jgi:integrase
VLLEATGRRRGSVRQLRWEDMTLPVDKEGEIQWRAEADKKRQEWITPIPVALVEALREFRRKLGAVGGLVFPTLLDPSRPIHEDSLSAWIEALADHAELPKLSGGVCHPFRRKWATERKHLPVKDVAAAGGWKDVGTLLTSYQQADRETMLAVMSESKKVTEAIAIGS